VAAGLLLLLLLLLLLGVVLVAVVSGWLLLLLVRRRLLSLRVGMNLLPVHAINSPAQVVDGLHLGLWSLGVTFLLVGLVRRADEEWCAGLGE
jgi:hypothetical protein